MVSVVSVANESERPVAAAVVVHKGRLLLVRRRVAEGQLSWQFPAGKVEPEESREAAAVREAQEETGLRVITRELLGERVHPATGRLMSYTACDVLSGTAHGARRGGAGSRGDRVGHPRPDLGVRTARALRTGGGVLGRCTRLIGPSASRRCVGSRRSGIWPTR